MAAEDKREEIKSNDGESLRISVCYDSETRMLSTELEMQGNKGILLQALIRIFNEQFDMICIPKEAIIGGIGMGIVEMPDITDEDDLSFEDFLNSLSAE